MTDPTAAAQDPAAVPPLPASLVTAAPAPASRARRGRRRWGTAALAAVAVAGLAAGLLVWAPWIPPPVLRPAGLRAGPVTATSVTFGWSRPRTGPLPDKYLILSNCSVAGSAAGTHHIWAVTSWKGTMTATFPAVSAAAVSCPAAIDTISLNASRIP